MIEGTYLGPTGPPAALHGGVSYRVAVRTSRGERTLHGPVILDEDLRAGVKTTFVMPKGAHLELDQDVELVLRSGEADRWTRELHLFARTIADESEPNGVEVLAMDPLSYLDEIGFRTWAGAKWGIASLTTQLLQTQSPLKAPIQMHGDAALQVPWFFQCEETGQELLNRVAKQHSAVIRYDGSVIVIDRAGAAPKPEGGTLTAVPRDGVFGTRRVRMSPPASAQVCWCDPDTLKLRVERPPAGNGEESSAASVARRVVAAHAPGATQRRGFVWPPHRRPRVYFVTGRVDLAPGAAIELTTGEVVVVESVRHYFGVDPWPGYWNVASAVAPELWGLGAAQPPRSYQLGPYLLVVLDHDDPEGQGRFRGRFMEDPAGYPTPWVICPVSADAGKDTGFYWPPRRGNLALVSASAACPEVLTWHGAVRGREQAVPTAWRDKQRPFVAMMPGRDGFIEFGAPNAFMTLDAQAGESKVYGARRSDVG